MTDAIRVLFVTIAPDKAEAFADAICRERVVACVNVLPGVRSHYWWQGELCHEEECVLLMETAADCLDAAMQRIAELHPYDTPKIVAFEPVSVNPAYAAWCRAETRQV
jgi:periplasmic divalent cation tolerance protein